MDQRDRLTLRGAWMPWAATSVALVLVAILAYGLGAHREAAAAGAPFRRGWFFGGFPGFWLVFLLFWFLLSSLRRMWWGWGWYPARPWRYRRSYLEPYDDERAEWEAWHRGAHERMGAPPTAGSDTPPPDAKR